MPRYLRRLSLRQKIRYFFDFYVFRNVYKKDRTYIVRWQETRLHELIAALEQNIIFYRAALASRSIRSGDIASIDDLQKLPILTKQLFRAMPVSEYTISSRAPSGRWVTTSGTSGMPFSAVRRTITSKLPLYRDFMRYRLLMEERPYRMNTNWARIALLRVLPLRRQDLKVIFADTLFSDPGKAIDELIAFSPDVIEGHASFLEELARNVRKFGRGPRPRYAISGSERLYPAARTLIEEALHCTVYNRFGLEETGTLGMDCRAHDGFHIYVESCIVEIVDSDGNQVPDGALGRVLVTDLYNFEMPLVRYDTGDRGRVSWEPCACGLRSQRLWINGRYSATLAFGPRTFHQFEFSEVMQKFTPFTFRYLIAKLADDAMEVRIIPSQSYTESVREQMTAAFESLVGPEVRIAVTVVDSIPRLPRGKSKIVLDLSR